MEKSGESSLLSLPEEDPALKTACGRAFIFSHRPFSFFFGATDLKRYLGGVGCGCGVGLLCRSLAGFLRQEASLPLAFVSC